MKNGTEPATFAAIDVGSKPSTATCWSSVCSTTPVSIWSGYTGAEEARLVQLAVSRKLNVRDKTVLVIDIGGGSVEFDIIDHGSHRLLPTACAWAR